MRHAILAATVFAVSTTPSLAAQIRNSGPTVNSHTEAQDARARKAVTEAGYQPGVLEAAQDGNLFYMATKGDDIYSVTMTPSGQTFASTGLPTQDMNKPPAG